MMGTAKEAGLRVLQAAGLLHAVRWLHRGSLVILTYHGVLPAGAEDDGFLSRNFVREDEFEWQMRYLARHYRCLSLSDAVDGLRGSRPLPPHAVVVTFDDGFRNNYTTAFPILTRYGIPAAIFLTTGHIGANMKLLWTERVARLIKYADGSEVVLRIGGLAERFALSSPADREQSARRLVALLKRRAPADRESVLSELERRHPAGLEVPETSSDRYRFLSWQEVGEMAAAGIEFGSHTVTHPIVSTLTDAERLEELAGSRRDIEQHLGHPCRFFSFPNGAPGDFRAADQKAIADLGYECALTQIPGLNGPGAELMDLRRINIGRGHSGVVFAAQVIGAWYRFRSWRNAVRAKIFPARPEGLARRAA